MHTCIVLRRICYMYSIPGTRYACVLPMIPVVNISVKGDIMDDITVSHGYIYRNIHVAGEESNAMHFMYECK